MTDLNLVIANNIHTLLKQQNKKQVELADALRINKQTVSKMLNGTRMISAAELKQTADFLGVKMEDLTRIRENTEDTDIVRAFMGKVDSEQARNALEIADKLSDLILFHARVRENGTAMMEAWDC